ncbi:MAG: NusA-like transcription termination signal-binding factor [Methanomicrobiales archaeon]|nr:NusA-like transcription termination signal-binding factor [Methanomicrobiales archaeon]
MERTIGFKERRYIEELRILTRATAVDCVIDEKFDRIIYLIHPGDMGLAIGKGGENSKKLQKALGKKIEMVEYADDLRTFIENVFKPAEISNIGVREDSKTVDVFVRRKADLGIAIGKGGANIEKARILLRRFFHQDIGDVSASGGEAGE